RRHRPAALTPGAPRGHTGHEHERLCVHGLILQLRGPLARHRPVVDARDRLGLGEGLLDGGIGEAVHHADGLRTLPGEDDGELHQYLRSTEPQVKPPPTPCNSTLCPGRMRPSRTATSSASGTEAAEVLAWRSTVTMHFDSGSPSFLLTCETMRTFAWWGM